MKTTKTYSEMFGERLVDLAMAVASKEEVFGIVAGRLQRMDFVGEGYLKALADREKAFPTGLATKFLNIALPHTDAEHIKKPFVYVVRLDDGVTARTMGDNREISVKDFFFLGVKNPARQVGFLQAFLNLFMDESFVQQFKECSDNADMHALFAKNI